MLDLFSLPLDESQGSTRFPHNCLRLALLGKDACMKRRKMDLEIEVFIKFHHKVLQDTKETKSCVKSEIGKTDKRKDRQTHASTEFLITFKGKSLSGTHYFFVTQWPHDYWAPSI